MWPARPIVPVVTGDGQAETTAGPTVSVENRSGTPTQLARARGSRVEAQGILALHSARARVDGVPIDDREMVAHLWQSTMFAICAGLLTLGFRRNRARVRYWLWFAASIKFLIPFSAIAAGVSVLPWAPAVQEMFSHLPGDDPDKPAASRHVVVTGRFPGFRRAGWV